MKKKMLIVERNIVHAAMLKKILEDEGFDIQILFSVNGMDVFCLHNDYDTIFMDIGLCDTCDLPLIAEGINIRPNTRLVLTTEKAENEGGVLGGSMELGGFGCIDKPFEKGEVKAIVAEGNSKKKVKRGFELAKYFLISLVFLGVLAFGTPGLAQGLRGVPASVDTPYKLAEWLTNDFEYKFEIFDEWQDPQETIDTFKGDCEDFAILASEVLDHLGISNDVIIVKFRDLKIGHAICLWKENDGTYSFISNRKLFQTGKNSVLEAIGKYYPDWESITYTDSTKKNMKIVKR